MMKENYVYKLSDNKNYYVSKAVKVKNAVYYVCSKLEDEDGQVVFLTEDAGKIRFVEDSAIISEIIKALTAEAKKVLKDNKETKQKATSSTKPKALKNTKQTAKPATSGKNKQKTIKTTKLVDKAVAKQASGKVLKSKTKKS